MFAVVAIAITYETIERDRCFPLGQAIDRVLEP